MELDISKLAGQVLTDIQAICEDEQKDLDTVMHEMAKETCEEVKRTSPVDTGNYKRGWRVTAVKKHGATTYVVKNTTEPALTNVLEFGTAPRKTKFAANRGQVDGKKYAHIRKSFNTVVNRHKTKLEQGG